MPRTGHDSLFDETVLDPHYETRMATIFLHKLAPDQFFRQRRSSRVERVGMHAWEDGRRRVCVARSGRASHERDRTPHRTTIGYCTIRIGKMRCASVADAVNQLPFAVKSIDETKAG